MILSKLKVMCVVQLRDMSARIISPGFTADDDFLCFPYYMISSLFATIYVLYILLYDFLSLCKCICALHILNHICQNSTRIICRFSNSLKDNPRPTQYDTHDETSKNLSNSSRRVSRVWDSDCGQRRETPPSHKSG